MHLYFNHKKSFHEFNQWSIQLDFNKSDCLGLCLSTDPRPSRMPRCHLVSAIFVLYIAAATTSPLEPAEPLEPLRCFVEYPSSHTVKNMCERQFHRFPPVPSAAECAAQCISDSTCIMFAWERSLSNSSSVPGQRCRLSSTCQTPTNALVGFDGYFRNSSTGKCAPGPSPAPGISGTWSRVFLTDAAARGAVCIDGSPAAYYIRTMNGAGVLANPEKWIIFMEGGGWASSLPGSVERASTDLGSSKGYPAIPTQLEGMMMFESPTFDMHTVVFAKYCDGGSFTGRLSNPAISVPNGTSGNVSLFFRGRGIFDGLFDDLFRSRGLSEARELLFAGCSAGGLTAYIHADAVTALMATRAPRATVVALADAMFSLNHLDFANDTHWPDFMKWVYFTMDAENR